MNYDQETGQTLVGKCLTQCFYRPPTNYSGCKSHNGIVTKHLEALNNEVCGFYSRTGRLCGRCVKGYGPPVYSYSLLCVKCLKSEFRYNLLKYIAVAFLPLTLFYVIMVTLKLSVTSSSMVAFTLVCQTVAFPSQIRMIASPPNIAMKVLITFFSIWNLDFFRSFYDIFCIHPSMNSLQVLALDYLVGMYPLVLVILTYIIVKLHDRYSVIVKLWRPAYKLFSFIRKEWNIHGTLVQAFATFLVLSYIKILNVSFDLLTPAYLQNIDGKFLKQVYVYNDGDLPYFGKKHLPYAVLAIVMSTLFNILPMILLVLYPCHCFQMILNKLPFQRHALSTFMDAFQGCYRHHPRDYRYFAAIYLSMRIFQQLIFTDHTKGIFIIRLMLDFFF